jgi:hypothetical protein
MNRFPGILELSLHGRGPKTAFLFDGHRFAFGCWADAAKEKGPGLLLTFDRHFDTVVPQLPIPHGLFGIEADEYAFRHLDARNYSHILAALDAQIVSHAIFVARARPVGSVGAGTWVDSTGNVHELVSAPTLDALAYDFGRAAASPESQRASQLIQEASHIVLDVDIDCFTSPSDAEPLTVLPWPSDVIRSFVMPPGSEDFWNTVLPKCSVLTVAKEPLHCGGVVAGHDLFKLVAQVIFVELFHAQLP